MLLNLLSEAGSWFLPLGAAQLLLDLSREDLRLAQVACFVLDVGWRGCHPLVRSSDLCYPHLLRVRAGRQQHVRVEHESVRKVVLDYRGVLAREDVLRIVVYRRQARMDRPRVDARDLLDVVIVRCSLVVVRPG